MRTRSPVVAVPSPTAGPLRHSSDLRAMSDWTLCDSAKDPWYSRPCMHGMTSWNRALSECDLWAIGDTTKIRVFLMRDLVLAPLSMADIAPRRGAIYGNFESTRGLHAAFCPSVRRDISQRIAFGSRRSTTEKERSNTRSRIPGVICVVNLGSLRQPRVKAVTPWKRFISPRVSLSHLNIIRCPLGHPESPVTTPSSI